jgi:DNA-binding transcriptional MocR family regulator
MVAAIARYFPKGTKVSRPMGGYFLWLELSGGTDSMALHHSAQAEGINFAPGPMFSASGEYSNCLRLNYGLPSDCIRSVVKTLGALAKSQE